MGQLPARTESQRRRIYKHHNHQHCNHNHHSCNHHHHDHHESNVKGGGRQSRPTRRALILSLTVKRDALRWADNHDDHDDHDHDDHDHDDDYGHDSEDSDDDDNNHDEYLVLPDGPRVRSEPANSDHHNWTPDHMII